MIASPSKNADTIAYHDLLEIVESAVRVYQQTGHEPLLKDIEELYARTEALRTYIDTNDYSREDAYHIPHHD